MTSVTTKPDFSQPAAETAVYLFDNWFDPIEGGLRDRVREFIHAMIEGELDVALSRPRNGLVITEIDKNSGCTRPTGPPQCRCGRSPSG